MKKLLAQLRRKRVRIPLSVILVIIVFVAIRPKSAPAATTARVARGTVTEAVFVTGSVKAEDLLDLGFEKTGRVAAAPVEVGQHVSRGALLASLSSASEAAGVESAKAELASAEARLAEISTGSRPEEIALKEVDLARSKQSLDNAYASGVTTLLDAYNKADNAVNKQADPLFTNDQSNSPTMSFDVSNQAASARARDQRVLAGVALEKLRSLADIPPSQDGEKVALTSAERALETVQAFLNSATEALTYEITLSESVAASYRDNMNTARTNVTTAITSAKSALQNITSAELDVKQSESELALDKLGSAPEVIAQQQSAVDQAEASVLSAEAAYGKDFLTAPASGTITRKDINAGEIAGANTPIISLQSDGQFQLEADVPEADIAKIRVGNTASTTLDAYGSDVVFAASVVSIDPAEKIVEGVATYKVTLAFAKQDDRIKSGMTANLTIVTGQKADALSVPQRAVIDQDGKRIVRMLGADGKTIVERTVTTGIRGENGEIEILSGLSPGESVVTFLKQ